MERDGGSEPASPTEGMAMNTIMRTAPAGLQRLRAALRGTVIDRHDAGYEQARGVYISGYDRRPLAIVRPADAADVARTVEFARSSGLPLAVRGGGHSLAGHGTCDDGIVLDVSTLRSLNIDATARTAWAGGGITAGEYTRAAASHGLATPLGDSPSVGIAGLALGGGIGLLHRRHGLTIDSMTAAEIVTADGQVLRADERHHADLFWAIRGGGGNFGVVTRLQFRLADVSMVTGGMLILPATPQSLAAFMDAALNAPESLSGVIMVMAAPPLPFLPPDVHGRVIIMALLAVDGTAAEGERALAPFRRIATPVADTVRPQQYAGLYDAPEGPHPAAVSFRSFFMDSFDGVDADVLLGALQEAGRPGVLAQLRVLGGAVARVPVDATAFAHRDRALLVAAAAMYGSRDDAPGYDEWTEQTATRLRHGAPASYVNFEGREDVDAVRAAYPGSTWQRLCAVKAKYDPANVFRLNQNIPPAAR